MYLILMQWQVQTHVRQKNKRFKFEKDLAAMIKLLKEEKAVARQEMKYAEKRKLKKSKTKQKHISNPSLKD